MRLDGSLEDFALPDILRLLAQTQKSGALHLHATEDERKGLIRVGGGGVDGASSDLRRHALARRLVGAGLVSDEALGGSAADVRAGAPSLVRALLDRAALPHEDVVRVATDQTTDAVCELLRWSAGTFSFLVGEPDPDAMALALRAEELVAEGQRRMQVWPTLTSHIPSPDSVLRLVASPAFDPSCTREEWGLLALVDGSRSVSEIVALLGSSEFAVAGALAALVERGLLTVSGAGTGLADLQRRQAIVAGLEAVVLEAEPGRTPAVRAEPAAPLVPAADIPIARAARAPVTAAAPHAVSEPPMTSDRLMTDGSAALDVAPDAAVSPVADLAPNGGAATVRGLDSAVTKSLVLRLIAGVRGL